MSDSKKSKDAEDILSEFDSRTKPQPEAEPETVVEPEDEVKPEVESEAIVEPEVVAEAEVEVKPEVVVEPEDESKTVVEPEVVAEAEVEVKPEVEPETVVEPEVVAEAKVESEDESKTVVEPEAKPIPEPSNKSTNYSKSPEDRDVIFVGTKPLMNYISATLTQLSTRQTVTIKARGKRITHAVDVSQMIIKRMNSVGYVISDVRISSSPLISQDGKQRNISIMEIDISKK